MKKFAFLTTMTAVFLFAVIMLASCTKEGPAGSTGAAGPMGSTGTAGSDGLDGINGTDGTAGCIECHDGDASLKAKEYQWEVSAHNAGSALSRAGSASCAPCHSHQGFMISDGNNPLTVADWAGVDDPINPNCYTCHNIHQTYTPSDLSFTYPDQPNWAVTLGKDVSMDLGSGNLCAHCHQSRTRTPIVDMADLTAEYGSLSTHFGPHYSPQANMMGGFGAYELEGSKTYPTGNGHLAATNGCVGCHMSYSTANTTGGHTMHIDTGSDLTKACVQCHTGDVADEYYNDYYALNFATIDNHGTATEARNTTSLYAVLGDLLEAKGIYTSEIVLDEDGDMDHVAYNINRGLTGFNGTVVAAFFNHRYVYQDHSHGVHNPKWVEALLQNSIDALNAL